MRGELILNFGSPKVKSKLRQGCVSRWQQKLTLISCVVTMIFFTSSKKATKCTRKQMMNCFEDKLCCVEKVYLEDVKFR